LARQPDLLPKNHLFHFFMASKAIYPVVAVLGIAAASGAAWWFQHKSAPAASVGTSAGADPAKPPASAASAAGPARPAAVEVAKVEITKLSDDAQSVGTLRSRQSVIIRPEVSGRVTQINFRDGDRVRKGQLLIQLDDQLQAAQIKQSEAELSIARANHKRNQELVAQNFISQRSVDESAANLEVAQARLALSQATAARLKIFAPFDGMTGIRTVNPGDYLKDGADVVNIEDIEAVFVDFRLPERFQAKVRKGQKAMVDLDALPGRKFEAFVQAVDPLIDTNGRSVGIRACIDNRQMQLRPGMFARVTAMFGERDRAKVVPEEAIIPQGQRQFVIKVVDGPEKDSKISQRVEVKVGIRRPGRVEVTEGLNEGDVVVVAGHQRLQKDGSPLRVLDLSRPVGGAAPGSGPQGNPGNPMAASGPPGSPMGAASAPRAVPTGTPRSKAAPARPVEGPNPCFADASADAAGQGRGPGASRPAGAGAPARSGAGSAKP
jgi:membrane fusion protein (multidrug efflux system)